MPWYVAVFELLVQVSLAGCALLGLASLAVWLLREPARKIRVIELALAGLLALPAVVLIPGYPRVAVLPARSAEVDRMPGQPPAPPGGRLERAARDNDPPTVATKNPPAKPGADREARNVPQPAADETESPATSVPPVRTANNPAHPNTARALPALSLPTDYRLWIVLAYLSGACAMFAWSLLGWFALRRLVRGSRAAEPSVHNLLRDLAGPSSDRVRLLVSARAVQPCAFGWWRPTIVLPESLVAGGDARQLRFALAHEWSHVVRGDLASWTLAGVARAVHFQQPLVWLLRRQLRLSQDYLADAAAAGTGTPEDYAEFLTNVSQAFKRPKLAPGLGIAARRSDLHRRVVMLVENARPLERVTPRRWNLLVVLAAISAVASVASLRAEPNPPEPTNKVQTVPPAAKKSAEPLDDARTVRRSPQPFSGKIRPGDILNIEIVGGILGAPVPPRTVEPDGNVALTAAYGADRIAVAGKSLVEAGRIIETHLREILKSPSVVVTYAGHDDGVIAEGQMGHTAPGTLISKAGPTTVAPARTHRPFSGKIRPGDILRMEMVGGIPGAPVPPRTVEPDGNIALSPAYGIKRINVAGKTLIEAGELITDYLKTMLKMPQVLVIYEGHDDGVVAVDQAGAAATSNTPAPSEVVLLKPLDTIEVTLGAKMNDASFPVGTYLIEPDGRVGLAATRLKLAGLTEREAGAALRTYMSEQPWLRKAPPSIHVVRRGHAVFPADKTPTAEYRVRAGDQLLLNSSGSAAEGMSREVLADGTLSWPSPFVGQEFPPLRVEGMTIDELQQSVRKSWKFSAGGGGTIQQSNLQEYPWSVTFGGWREEADPAVIDRIEQADSNRVERLEQELQEIKTMIRGLQPR